MEPTNQVLIKGMVCDRCISVIKDGITALGYPVEKISLGKVSLTASIDKTDLLRISNFLVANGFDLLNDRHTKLINQVKEIIDDVFSQNIRYDNKLRFSVVLAESLHMNYDSISEAFSESEGVTLEHFIINKRLEKVKELLVYTEFALTEIAYITGFSSLNHLSTQFKELTGFSPSHFKKVRSQKDALIKLKGIL